MQNTGGAAVKRIFVKVFGFSDVERHALNTVFRLSESRPQAYALWNPEAPDKAQVLLLDGDSWEAALELANPANDKLKLCWVGAKPPGKVWQVFTRPLRWSAVIEAMDSVYAPSMAVAAPVPALASASSADLDFDLDALPAMSASLDLDLDLGFSGDSGDADTAPAPLDAPLSPSPDSDSRVLVIDPDRDARLYLRAKMASVGLMQVDEATTGAEAMHLLRFHVYRLVVLDLELADVNSWKLVRQLNESTPPIRHVILTGASLSKLDAVRGWFSNARGSLAKPLDPVRLRRLLKSAQVD